MKAMTLAAAAFVALSGFAIAGEDESAITIDLGASKDANSYFLKCRYGGKDLSSCSGISIWENTNGVRGLQTSTSMTGTPPDKLVLS